MGHGWFTAPTKIEWQIVKEIFWGGGSWHINYPVDRKEPSSQEDSPKPKIFPSISLNTSEHHELYHHNYTSPRGKELQDQVNDKHRIHQKA
jgi:hypothetical protein